MPIVKLRNPVFYTKWLKIKLAQDYDGKSDFITRTFE